MSPPLSSMPNTYTHYASTCASSRTPSPSHAAPATPADASSPMSSLAAIYASYVVRVHTRHGIRTLSFDHLAAFFTLTAKRAAEDLGISSRTLIRVCRSLGIRRWPYLGFRSEKNVERIRLEAIANLRRKLEKDGAASPTTATHTNASSLRGASAKRLLQVQLPQSGSMAPMSIACSQQHSQQLYMSPASSQRWSVQSIDDTESEDDSDVEMSDARVSPMHLPTAAAVRCHSTLPLVTPQSQQHGFNLDVRSMSPAKSFVGAHAACLIHRSDVRTPEPAHMRYHQQQQHASRPLGRVQPLPHLGRVQPLPHLGMPSSLRSSYVIPSLNLLVDASILTSFKHDSAYRHQQLAAAAAPQPLQCPRMSMRDILSDTAMAA